MLVIDSSLTKFGIEIYKDVSRRVLYIQKIDSNLRLKGLASTCIRGLMEYFDCNWYIYAATGDTYLFSSSTKPGRDDRALIKWWMTVVDIHDHKSVWIPGESQITTRSLFPSDTWEWGLGVDLKAVASETLPMYEDDLVTKAMGYADPKASVGDLMGIMECMEMHAGLRALIWLRGEKKQNVEERILDTCQVKDEVSGGIDEISTKNSSNFETQFDGITVVEDMDEILTFLTSLDFATVATTEISTRIFVAHVGLDLENLPFCDIKARDVPSGEKGSMTTRKVNDISSSLIKKKPVVNTISSSLVKKKAAVTIESGLIKKKLRLA